MKLKVKALNEDGSIAFEGNLNRNEVSFLLGYSINGLVADGVQFNLTDPDEEDDDENAQMRLKFPEREDLDD